jgi:hypothetical protein
MRAITENQSEFLPPFRVTRPGTEASTNFSIVCLWSVLGLTLTALLFALGLGAEVGQILAMAG